MSYALTGNPTRSFQALQAFGVVDYAADHAAWLAEKAAYDRAVMGFAAASAGASAGWSMAMGGYQRDLAAWNTEAAAYSKLIVARQQQQLKNQIAKDKANAEARAAGVVIPAGYSGCVSQAQHDSWVATCSWASTTVKGLGADPTGSPCALALLPVCPPPIPPLP